MSACAGRRDGTAGGERQDDARDDQEPDQDEAEGRVERPEQQPGEDRDEDGHDRRRDDPDVEVLERLDVGDDARQQVAAATAGQPGRRERLDRGEEPDPQVGEDGERRAVGDVALEVAERRRARSPARGPR